MWTCPGCGRAFKKTNQAHYCRKSPENVDAYIESQSVQAQARITELRTLIHRCVSGVQEKILWSMPYFELNKRTLSFAACKSRISLYLDAEIIKSILPQLEGFTIKKNALYLPYDKELPIAAIENAVKLTFE